MDNILIVSSAENGKAFLSELLRARDARTATASSAGEARRLLISQSFDLALINAPLSDELGHDLALELSNSAVGVLLFVKAELADEVSERVGEYGVFVLSKPLHREFFHQALRMVRASSRRMDALRQENDKLRRKLEEQKLVSRAKNALMLHLRMTEQQAHRHIEKQAMDKRVSRREIAQNILTMYEM